MGRRMGARGLANVSVGALQAELVRRERSTRTLHAARRRLLAKLEGLEAKIAAAGGSLDGGSSASKAGAGRRRGRGRRGPGIGRTANSVSLPEAMLKVLKGKTMGVTELATAVKSAGYKSSSANFRTIVNQALLKHKNKFKKVSRGQYTA